MAEHDPSRDDVSIRDVQDGDLEAFYEHQLDPEATRMAAFPSRGRDTFMAHWAKIRATPSASLQTVVVNGEVAGNIVSWDQDGARLVGYWIGRPYWGRGIATKALALFVDWLGQRPLYAYVAVTNVGSIRVLEKAGFTPAGEQAPSPPPDADHEDVEESVFILP